MGLTHDKEEEYIMTKSELWKFAYSICEYITSRAKHEYKPHEMAMYTADIVDGIVNRNDNLYKTIDMLMHYKANDLILQLVKCTVKEGK